MPVILPQTQTVSSSGAYENGGTYPFVNSTYSPSGHINEVNDTLGSESLFRKHKSGTFEFIGPTGEQIIRVLGGRDIEIHNYDNVVIHGKSKIVIVGSCEIDIANDLDIKVGGNMTTTVAGNHTLKVGGNSYKEITNESASNVGSESKTIQKNSASTYNGTYSKTTHGDSTTTAHGIDNSIRHKGGSMTTGSSGVLEINGPKILITAQTELKLVATTITTESVNATTIKAGTTANINGKSVSVIAENSLKIHGKTTAISGNPISFTKS